MASTSPSASPKNSRSLSHSMFTFTTRHLIGLLLTVVFLTSCSHMDQRQQWSAKSRTEALELMAQASRQQCVQTYANDAVRSAALVATGLSVSRQCECTYDMTMKLATEQQAINFLQATAYANQFSTGKIPPREFWSVEYFEAVHNAAMHVCERQGEISFS